MGLFSRLSIELLLLCGSGESEILSASNALCFLPTREGLDDGILGGKGWIEKKSLLTQMVVPQRKEGPEGLLSPAVK